MKRFGDIIFPSFACTVCFNESRSFPFSPPPPPPTHTLSTHTPPHTHTLSLYKAGNRYTINFFLHRLMLVLTTITQNMFNTETKKQLLKIDENSMEIQMPTVFLYLNRTHWDRRTHICVSKLVHYCIFDNGLEPMEHQAVIWTYVGFLSIGH